MAYLMLNLALTTYCSMACPDCVIDIPRWKNKQHYPWEYFEQAAQYLAGHFKCVTLAGGEPTLHPRFVEFAPKLRDLFRVERLHLETNGWGFDRFTDVFRCFDKIACSQYKDDSFAGCPDNAGKIAAYKARHGEKSNLVTGKTVFVPRNLRPGTKPCARLGILAYFDSLLYPCCAEPGLPTKVGISLTSDWEQRLAQVKAPCADCFFALP